LDINYIFVLDNRRSKVDIRYRANRYHQRK